MGDDKPRVFGTSDLDAPATRAELERAIRYLTLSDLDLRDHLLKLAAHVVALTDELVRRVDGVEPQPAPPNTPSQPPEMTIEDTVQTALPEVYANIKAADVAQVSRVSIDVGDDKYTVTPSTPPCAELIPICEARCCKLSFSLSSADLDEGVIRWDYGQPYLIRQRASDGRCVHNDPESHFCTVHQYRPRVCRVYDCRQDPRIWVDYEKRIPAPLPEGKYPDKFPPGSFDLVERARKRANALAMEKQSMATTFADTDAQAGPDPKPRKA
jgi:hypothetical protein